jgi:hypothetical protein
MNAWQLSEMNPTSCHKRSPPLKKLLSETERKFLPQGTAPNGVVHANKGMVAPRKPEAWGLGEII